MSNKQRGFTLIELVLVVVILGILSVVALPKFIDLSEEAQVSAIKGLAGSIESSSGINHAVDIAVEAGVSSDTFQTIDNCSDAGTLLTSNALPAGYTVAAAAVADKATVTCTLTHTASSETATFIIIGAN